MEKSQEIELERLRSQIDKIKEASKGLYSQHGHYMSLIYKMGAFRQVGDYEDVMNNLLDGLSHVMRQIADVSDTIRGLNEKIEDIKTVGEVRIKFTKNYKCDMNRL